MQKDINKHFDKIDEVFNQIQKDDMNQEKFIDQKVQGVVKQQQTAMTELKQAYNDHAQSR